MNQKKVSWITRLQHCPNWARWAVFSLAFLFPLMGFAQGTGTVQGRVLNQTTGSYVGNARVSAQGTDRVAYTDTRGAYNLTLVPAGQNTIIVTTPSGLRSEVAVDVVAGETIRQEVAVQSVPVQTDEEIIELEAFDVVSEADAYTTAIAEMRQSKNNKTVVDSGVFGDVAEGNVGEFIKFIPGISVNYVAADVRSIEVRGMGANFTPVTVDGNRMASAASSGGSRTFELEQVSINNVERIEVTKVPTPNQAADSLGGSVNLVSKSAFERTGRSIRYKVYLNGNSESLDIGDNPWGSSNRSLVLPGVDFSYSDVFMDGRLGVMLTYLNSNQFNEQHRTRQRWDDFEEFGDQVDNPIPIMRRYQYQDGPKFTYRRSYGVRLDYKISETTHISSGAQYNTYLSQFRNDNIQWDTNQNERSDSNGNYIGTDRVESRNGGGDIDIGGSWRDKSGDTFHGDIALKHVGTNFEFDVGGFWSRGTNEYDDLSEGFLEQVSLDWDVPGQIIIDYDGDITGGYVDVPTVTVTDDDGNPIPNMGFGDPAAYAGFDLLEIGTREADSTDEFKGIHGDVTYHMDLGGVDTAISGGALFQSQERDNYNPRYRYQYVGPDDGYDPSDFINYNYLGEESGIPGIPSLPLVDHSVVAEFYHAHPDWFAEGSRFDDNINALAAGDFVVKEDISAAYLMAELQFFDNRLWVTGGARYEKTEVSGTAWDVDNSDASAPVITGTVGADRSYDDVFPSVNVKFDITNNLTLRLGYAATMGRPEFTDILPLRQISDPEVIDPEDSPLGSVNVNNTGLEPWTADSYDITLEYYFGTGGYLSASIYRKDIDGIIVGYNIGRGNWDPDTQTATGGITQTEIDQFGLPDYVLGYSLDTDINLDKEKVDGFELSFIYAMKNVEQLPNFLRDFTVFANGTWQDGDLPNFVDKVINIGATYETERIKAQVKYNLRGRKKLSSGTDGSLVYDFYYEDFPTVDINLEYRFSKAIAVFLNGRNIFEEPQDRIYVASEPYPMTLLDRGERFGVQWTLGMKGSF